MEGKYQRVLVQQLLVGDKMGVNSERLYGAGSPGLSWFKGRKTSLFVAYKRQNRT